MSRYCWPRRKRRPERASKQRSSDGPEAAQMQRKRRAGCAGVRPRLACSANSAAGSPRFGHRQSPDHARSAREGAGERLRRVRRRFGLRPIGAQLAGDPLYRRCRLAGELLMRTPFHPPVRERESTKDGDEIAGRYNPPQPKPRSRRHGYCDKTNRV
jgi:hypothetical protein